VLLAHFVTTGVVSGTDYAGTFRVWARHGTLPVTADVKTDVIVRPVGSFPQPGSACILPRVTVKNNTGQPTIPFNVKLSIEPTNPPLYPNTKSVPALAANATYQVDFDSFNLTIGAFTLKCSTMLYADQNTSNNAKVAYFQGCNFVNYADVPRDSFVSDPPEEDRRWQRGAPQPPWAAPPMGLWAWGYKLSGTYMAGDAATLTSRSYYRASQANPVIAFQHNFGTILGKDGGNFSYSTDGGSNWTVLTPSAGLAYTGFVSALAGNGWSGYPVVTSGWNQSVFTIPMASGTFQVRWRFAADDGNAPGWLVGEIAGIGCDLSDAPPPQPGDSVIGGVNLSSNPLHGPGQVSYTLKKDCNVSLKLHDASGRLAERLTAGGSQKGTHTVRFDATRLRRGVYFLVIEGEGDRQTTKVVIQ
jgi:hypothetical protein